VKRSSLRTKITVTTILAVAVLAFAMVLIMISFMNYLSDAILLEIMRPLAKTTAMSVQGHLYMLADRMFLIADNSVFADTEAPLEKKQQALDLVESGIEFVWLGLYNADGLLETGKWRCPLSIQNKTFYTGMRETRNLVIEDVHVGSSGEIEIVIGTPLFRGEEISHYLVGSYRYNVLNDMLSAINISSGSTAYIINEEGKFMAHQNMDKIRFGESVFSQFPHRPELEDILLMASRGQIDSKILGIGGGQKIYAFAPIRGTGWSLVIETPWSDFMTGIRQGVFVSILITLVLLVCFTFISNLFIDRALTKPLWIITENARRINRGIFNDMFPRNLISRNDEIGQLAGAFVSMSRFIGESIGEIEKIIHAIGAGQLDQRAQLAAFEGDFSKIVSGVNNSLDVICSYLDAIPMALALFNEKREMLYRNRAMTEFLIIHGLEAKEPRLLEQIAGSGGGWSGDTLDPKAAAIFDPAVQEPLPFTTDIAMLGVNGGDNFLLNLQRAGSAVPGRYSVCAILLLSDVTQLTQAKLNAEAASRAKSDFLSRMSHEIRTPMNAIIGMTQIAKSTEETQRIRSCIEQIEGSSNHLLGVVNDILDFSKIESSKLTLDISEFSLSASLDFVLSMMLSMSREKNIPIRLNVEEIQNDGLSSDALRLNQVLINILSNAVKFSPEGSEVFLNVRELEHGQGFSTYRFEIVDHGIGISERQIEKLFRPFEQADGGITRNYGGTGLGLVISKGLVEMMGGDITIKSREGEGSVFAFTIRCAAKPELEKKTDEEVKEAIAGNYDFSGKRCLVVDDIEINREIILELLSATDIALETAENGRDALEKFKASGIGYFDIILMDMQMPVMDGCTATREIRSLEREDAAVIPIIAMTANVMQEDVRKAIESGMNSHLGKPVEMELLLKTIQAQLSKQASREPGVTDDL
jgi:signal transduction histidine kinase/CheY-like chemotaxis protein